MTTSARRRQVTVAVWLWAVVALGMLDPAAAQTVTILNPVEDASGSTVGLDSRKRCNAGTAIGAGCAVDADCPGSATVGRCETAPAQDMVSLAPSWAVRATGRVTCSGTSTPVTLGAGWRPCWQLRVTNPVGNDTAHVGYTGMTTSTSRRLEPGTMDFALSPPADADCGAIVFRCTSGQELEVVTP